MDIRDYNNSKIPIEYREDCLYEDINRLEEECSQLFYAIVNLDNESFNNIEGLINWFHDVIKKYNLVDNAYEHLSDLEYLNAAYAERRYEAKKAMANVTAVYALFVSLLFGLVSLYVLRNHAKKFYDYELSVINERREKLNKLKLDKIKCMLGNCERILSKKYNDYLLNENDSVELKKQLN